MCNHHTGMFRRRHARDRLIAIDQNPADAFGELRDAYRENRSAGLPELSPQPQPLHRLAVQRAGAGIAITRYNEMHDVEDLIRFYGTRPARRHGLYFRPFHSDDHASLAIYSARGQRYCHWFSRHGDCPLAQHYRNDAFNIYCIRRVSYKPKIRPTRNDYGWSFSSLQRPKRRFGIVPNIRRWVIIVDKMIIPPYNRHTTIGQMFYRHSARIILAHRS
jgi:hypothetical protein